MIRIGCFVTLVLLLMIGTSLTSANPGIPDLVGNWTGTSTGHDRVGGYDGPSSWQILMSITEQRDRAFNGTIFYTNIVNPDICGNTGFSGAIGPDMKAVYLAEYSAGFIIGQIIDSDTLEFIYLESGKDASAAIDIFTREVQK